MTLEEAVERIAQAIEDGTLVWERDPSRTHWVWLGVIHQKRERATFELHCRRNLCQDFWMYEVRVAGYGRWVRLPNNEGLRLVNAIMRQESMREKDEDTLQCNVIVACAESLPAIGA